MLNNVKESPFFATGDGTTDDRPAIQRAINDAAADPTKAGIFFPAGTYRVSKVGTLSGETAKPCSLELNGVEDFMVTGEGPRSVVKLVNTTKRTGDWDVFVLRNKCGRIVFKDLVIDGNRTGLTEPDQQSHGIHVQSGTEDLVIDRCILRECFGDGVRLLGTARPGQNVKRLRIENCLFQTNKRSGLSIQRETEQIIIANCIFDATVSDNSIDIEPTSRAAGPTDLLIQGCLINHTNATTAVHLSGISGPHPLVRCKFSDNIVLGGPIFCTDVNQLTIQNNIVHVTNPGFGKRIPVDVQRGGDSVIISGNLVIDDRGAEAVIRLSEVNSRQVTRALVANNLCLARAGSGIACRGSDDVAVQGNMIVATASCVAGIFLRSEGSPMENISVRDNDITVKGKGKWKAGIHVSASVPHHIDHFSVIGNSISGAATGVEFAGSRFRKTPVFALNRLADDVTSAFTGIERLPEDSLIVGGAASRGGTQFGSGRFIAGLGNPNSKGPGGVIGSVGDIFQRLDGIPGETLYVKETGNNTKTGWTAK
jgi:hypothetical protein